MKKSVAWHWGRAAARRIPGAPTVARAVRRRIRSRRFRTEYNKACARGDVRLQIGSGPYHLAGWLNTDISFDAPLFLDACRRFPVKDNSVHYIFCEHFLEHIPRDKGVLFLKECFRTLQPKGILRMSTPDVEAHARAYLARSERGRLLLERNRQHGYQYANYFVDILNKAFYADSHVCLYDADALEQMLRSVGFENITLCKVGESRHTALSGIERHYVGSIHDEFTLVIEAEKLEPESAGQK